MPKIILEPFTHAFEFAACQAGASEYQVAECTGRAPRQVREDNRKIGAVLAYPYHDRRGPRNPTLDDVGLWWQEWMTTKRELAGKERVTLVEFRQLIDDFLTHTNVTK